MTAVITDSEWITSAPASVAVADTPQGLFSIHNAGCAAVVWRRQPLAGFQAWIDALDPEQLPHGRMIVPASLARQALLQICEVSGTPECDERARLVDDAAALADIFASIVDASLFNLRLEAVSTDACRKFHVDTVKARLICTYRGIGTQYGISADRDEPREVSTVPTGAPVILRGKLWPGTPCSGLLHRSPPIEGTGETRLVLALTPADEPTDEFPQQPMAQTETRYGPL